jgi:hypothetical protein
MKKLFLLVVLFFGFSAMAQAQSLGVGYGINLSGAVFLPNSDLPFSVQLSTGSVSGGLRLRASNLITAGGNLALTAQADILIPLFKIDPLTLYIGVGGIGQLVIPSGGSFAAVIGAEGVAGLAFQVIPNISLFGEVNVVKYLAKFGNVLGDPTALPLGIAVVFGIALGI